ncbi:MAG: 4Fe-4S binding protein [Elusimicrobia bacterium]|nr:4Fe-4S binding protein [Elusimicrobiota bacterium]
MTLIPAALTKTIIFPGTMTGTYAAIAAMFVIWIGASLTLGRGWCSWGCFFGGLDDGFSRVLGRPVLKAPPGRWVDLPFAILLLVVVWSAASLSPAYCEWFCPFKAVTEFTPVSDWRTLAQAVSFASLFLAFVIVLPLLMKRRAQCALLCPFGAFQSAANWVDPFAVRVDTGACVKCRLCVQRCTTFSLTDESLAAGRALQTCVKCGKCVDSCPQGAVHFHVKGTGPQAHRETARVLFLYPAFLFLATFAGGNCMDAIAKLVRLATTGRLF